MRSTVAESDRSFPSANLYVLNQAPPDRRIGYHGRLGNDSLESALTLLRLAVPQWEPGSRGQNVIVFR